MLIRPANGFDYESIADASVASDMRSAAERIRQRTRAAYIETGRELIAIKTRLEYGSFVAWVERECEINIRTAQRMMAVVELIEKNDRLSYLPPSTLSLLTARSTPVVEAVDALSGRIDAGERPSTKQVSALIAKAHEEKKELGRQWQQERKRREERERRVGRRLSDEEHRQADQQRAKRLERETKKLEETEAQRRASTRAAARMLAEHLKDRLDEFIELVKDLGWWDIQFSLSELRDARGLQPRSTGRDERT